MPTKLGTALWTLGLLILAVLSWQWTADRESTSETVENSIEMAANETDYFLEDFHIVRVEGAQGEVFELRGDSLSHYLKTGHSTIEQPNVLVNAEDNVYWRGVANTGTLSADFNILNLSGNVDLEHRSGTTAELITVTTPAITINTQSRTLDTPEPVAVNASDWSFNATGMTADTNAGKLMFHSKVQATFGTNNAN